MTSRFGGPTWLRDDALTRRQGPRRAAAQQPGGRRPAGRHHARRPATTTPSPRPASPPPRSRHSTGSRQPRPGRSRPPRTAASGTAARTPSPTSTRRYPGRVAGQLADLSRLLDILLTSKLEKPVKLGIVGLPNVGKTTLFNALTHANAAATAYAYTSAESNIGVVARARPAARPPRRGPRDARRRSTRPSTSSTSPAWRRAPAAARDSATAFSPTSAASTRWRT